MKTIIAYSILVLMILACGKDKFDLSNVPNEDKYKENHIKYDFKNQAGKKEGKRELNDQIELDVYVPNYTKSKGEEVCKFYDEYYKTNANQVEKKLTININIWSKKIEQREMSDPEIEKEYFKGGLLHNYKNDIKEMNLDE